MSLILSGTDGLSDVDGSAATPAIRGTDANTGVFFPAADTIAFSEGGVESMRIDSSGNVGIGTNSPAAKLDVVGSLRATGITANGGVLVSGANQITIDYTGGSRIIAWGANTSTAGNLGFFTASSDASVYNERVSISEIGNVGINTNNPQQKLHINDGVLLVEKASAGSTLIVKNDSQGSGQGGQLQLTNSHSGVTNPNKFLRVGDSGIFSIINSAYTQSLFDITDAGVANSVAGYQKNGVNIVSFAFGDVTVTGLTTSYQEILITLPNSTVYTSVVSIVPITGTNDIVYLQGIALGEWSGVQTSTQARLIIKLGNAVASTSCTVRVYYRV